MTGLYKGILEDGTTLKSYFNSLGYGISIIPNTNMKHLQAAFFNSAYTYKNYSVQITKAYNYYRNKKDQQSRDRL